MPQTKTLSDYLQRKSVNVASDLVVLNSTQDCLKRMRSESKNVNNQIEAAISVAKYLGTDPIADFARLHKNIRRPEAENFELQQISIFYRTEFFKFIDSLSATLAEKEKCLRVIPHFNTIAATSSSSVADTISSSSAETSTVVSI
eukprot:gene10238-18924_t